MKGDIISVTVNIKRSLKERADAVKERRGDLTQMIEEGLEIVVQEREKRLKLKQLPNQPTQRSEANPQV